MSSSLESATPPSQPATRARVARRRDERSDTGLYRVIWRWHFFAGVLVAPILIVMAATGALYIFKDEIESLIYADVLFVESGPNRVSADEQLRAAVAGVSPEFTIQQFDVPADPARSTTFYASSGARFRRLLVDPYHGVLLGEIDSQNFFGIVLKIHRTLFAGAFGRMLVELVTSWTIVLLVSGVYLWWPRRRKRLWGVWLLRWRRHSYVRLRDLHAVSGAYVAAVALLIAGSGLLYTQVWGSGYALAATHTGAYEIFLNPPESRSSDNEPRAPLDSIIDAAARALPGRTLSVTIPREPRGAFVVFGSRPRGPSTDGVVIIDHATGEVLNHRPTSQYPALGWWATWNYPLHVGSVLGLPTKILWLVACVVLMLLPATGVWMWWRRRPSGQTGFPRRLSGRVPGIVAVAIIALALVLPLLAISIVVILLADTPRNRAARRARI